jgi:3-deoxy-manno-octulosonate cytidylyltransferase (CMP-KDO synthetase)
MVVRVMEAAQRSKLDDVVVATDSKRIAELVDRNGGRAVLTSPQCATGTDRVLEAVRQLGDSYDVVLNIQGDEPLLHPDDLNRLIESMRENPNRSMATLARPLAFDDIDNLNCVKVIVDQAGDAIYFSRWPIPFSRERILGVLERKTVMSHIGLYAFRKTFLEKFCEVGPTELERSESLEQLRALWMGHKIYVIPTEHFYRGVDTAEDVQAVEKYLSMGR